MSSAATLTESEIAQLTQTVEMFEVITQSQPQDYQSLEILKEAYSKLGRESELIDTSRRIARAYVQMGQFSSGILEYESILQRCPEDQDALAALQEIESKATGLSAREDVSASSETKFTPLKAVAEKGRKPVPTDLDDGRQTMRKIFVDAKVISANDFDNCWVKQDWSTPPTKPVPTFLQVLADRNVMSMEKALKVVSDKVRLGFLSIDRYDIDIELARNFPAETCLRWGILPFDRMSKSILVATSNPFNRHAASELEVSTKQRFLWYLASPTEISLALQKVFR